MCKSCENRYKIGRETSGYTQEKASEMLHISPRTLSDYENGHTRVPDDIVAAMTEIYNAPLLAWWHLKETSPLGKFLPDLLVPQTNGDMAFQLVLAEDELSPAVNSIKRIISDGRIDEDESGDFKNSIMKIQNVNGKLMSAVAYAEQQKLVR